MTKPRTANLSEFTREELETLTSQLDDAQFVRFMRTSELPKVKTVAELTDDDFVAALKPRSGQDATDERPRNRPSRWSGFSGAAQIADLTDSQMLQAKRDLLDGTVAQRRALHRAAEQREDLLQ